MIFPIFFFNQDVYIILVGVVEWSIESSLCQACSQDEPNYFVCIFVLSVILYVFYDISCKRKAATRSKKRRRMLFQPFASCCVYTFITKGREKKHFTFLLFVDMFEERQRFYSTFRTFIVSRYIYIFWGVGVGGGQMSYGGRIK